MQNFKNKDEIEIPRQMLEILFLVFTDTINLLLHTRQKAFFFSGKTFNMGKNICICIGNIWKFLALQIKAFSEYINFIKNGHDFERTEDRANFS